LLGDADEPLLAAFDIGVAERRLVILEGAHLLELGATTAAETFPIDETGA